MRTKYYFCNAKQSNRDSLNPPEKAERGDTVKYLSWQSGRIFEDFAVIGRGFESRLHRKATLIVAVKERGGLSGCYDRIADGKDRRLGG